VGLVAIVAVFLLYPAAASLVGARQLVNHQRQVYDIYAMQAMQHPEAYGALSTHVRILNYEYFAAAMDDVHSLAQYYGLEITRFDATQWTDYYSDMDGGGFIERRVSAAFTGSPDQGAGFIYGLTNSAAFIRNLRMDFLENGIAALQVEFSLFGREQ